VSGSYGIYRDEKLEKASHGLGHYYDILMENTAISLRHKSQYRLILAAGAVRTQAIHSTIELPCSKMRYLITHL
jgi:hypothetical protein